MRDKILSLFKQSGVYGIGSIAARAVGFLLLPYYSHLMTPDEFGLYSLFMVLVTIAQPLYVHGIDIAFMRYAADAEPPEQRRALGTALAQGLLAGGVLSFLLVAFAPLMTELVVSGSSARGAAMVRLSAGFMLIDTLSNYLLVFMRIRRRAALFSVIKLGNVLVNISLNVWLVGAMNLGAVGAFWAFFITAAVELLTLLAISWGEIAFGWTWREIRCWLAFGLPNLPAMLFMAAIEFSDRKWIESLLSVGEAGLYSAGYRIGMLMSMIAQSFRYAWQPFFLQHSRDVDARETYARVMTYFVAFVSWLWLVCALLLGDALRMRLPGVGALIHPSYWPGLKVFPVVMLAHIFNGVFANLMVGVYIKERTKIIPLVIGAAAVVNVAGNGLLIPVYGYMASAWLTVASYGLMAFLMYLYIAPRYPIPYEWRRLSAIALTIAVLWGVSRALPESSSLGAMVVLSCLPPVIWWLTILHPSEKEALLRMKGKYLG